jgi:hypothetical protein
LRRGVEVRVEREGEDGEDESERYRATERRCRPAENVNSVAQISWERAFILTILAVLLSPASCSTTATRAKRRYPPTYSVFQPICAASQIKMLVTVFKCFRKQYPSIYHAIACPYSKDLTLAVVMLSRTLNCDPPVFIPTYMLLLTMPKPAVCGYTVPSCRNKQGGN